MPRTTGRMLALLGLLQSRREWTGAQLRERLEVSERTLRRDIDDLRDLGYGIEASPGVGGGYRLGPGAAVPPLTLAADEAVAIAVGLRAATASVITGMEDAAVRALAKLEMSLSAATRAQIVDVEQAMVPLETARGDFDLDLLTRMARAIAEHRRIDLTYQRHDTRIVQRTVEPHRIVHTAARWYLIAWDADRRGWRTLRVDRIAAMSLLAQTFTARSIPDEQLQQFTSRSISAAPYSVRARVRVDAPAGEVRKVFGPTVAEVVDGGDGTSILTTGGHRPEEIALYLGTSGLRFEIIDGEQVRTTLQRLAEEFLAASGGQGRSGAEPPAPGPVAPQ
ncbi:MAG TPA: YafY family protein [Beutenbergiaceae bacterium]|nr:YafY family protein [Beutenbergiaceae bacterium]